MPNSKSKKQYNQKKNSKKEEKGLYTLMKMLCMIKLWKT